MGRVQLKEGSQECAVDDPLAALEALLAVREAFADSLRWTVGETAPTTIVDTQRLLLLRRLVKCGATLHLDCSDGRFQSLAGVAADLGWRADASGKMLHLDKPDQITQPLVSVLIAAWNPRYFAAALRSALKQTYTHIEVVIADDSPTNEIELMLERIDAGSRIIRYVRNPERLKVRKNYQTLLDLARGDLIKYLNDDDLLEPRCIERMVATIQRHPEATLVTSARSRIDERGGPMHDQPATQPFLRADAVIEGASLTNTMLMSGINIVGEPTTTLFRRRDVGVIDDSLFTFRGSSGRGVSDMVLWSKLLCRGHAVYLRERLSSFRIHAEQGQQRAEVIAMTTNGMRDLQATWLAFGLHELSAPQVLLTRAVEVDATRPFMLTAPAGFLAHEHADATALQAQWRAKQHPFFQQQAA